jgi:hypothetical protein
MEWLTLAGGAVVALAGVLVTLAWGAAARTAARERRARASGLYPSPGSGTDADVWRLLEAGETVLAIKLYRELYSVDLKSARAAIDALGGIRR